MSFLTSAPAAAAAPVSARPRGALIVLEGLDRSGKTTQVARLAAALSQTKPGETGLANMTAATTDASASPTPTTAPATDAAAASVSTNGASAKTPKAGTQRYPDSSFPCGSLARSYLTQAATLDDRAIHLVFAANRWESVTSLQQRLEAGETVVVDRYSFSGIAYSAMKGLPVRWLAAPEVGLPKPDAVVFLTVSSEVQAKRGGFGDEIYEKVELQKKVRREFAKLRRTRAGREWKVVDADQSEDQVAEAVLAAVQDAIAAVKNGAPLRVFEAADFEEPSATERQEEKNDSLKIDEDL